MRPNPFRRLTRVRRPRHADPHGPLSRTASSATIVVVNRSDPSGVDDEGFAYFKRDDRLFELAAEDWRLNAGLGPSIIREAALRDIVTEEVRFVTGESIAGYQPVAATAT